MMDTAVTKIQEILGVGKTQVYETLKNKEKIQRDYNYDKRKLLVDRHSKYSAANKRVIEWFMACRSKKFPLTGPLIRGKAATFALSMGLNDFEASQGWLQKFIYINQLSSAVLCSEGAEVQPETIEEWKKNLPVLLEGYQAKDVFNWNETGLFSETFLAGLISTKKKMQRMGKWPKIASQFCWQLPCQVVPDLSYQDITNVDSDLGVTKQYTIEDINAAIELGSSNYIRSGTFYSKRAKSAGSQNLIAHSIACNSNSDSDWSDLDFWDPDYFFNNAEFPDDEIEETEPWKHLEKYMGSTENCVRMSRQRKIINYFPYLEKVGTSVVVPPSVSPILDRNEEKTDNMSPMDYFKSFIPDDLLDKICEGLFSPERFK
ncbi:unnamed protein product [Lepeophtheirus salmonis]|uniref:(salmon louse) hypothetical protein n=1 Tax=Lepeophtheirus salmonis TaxID=72036 RepID=A0A7R8CUH7_LEPSM|nr:unnamed protein product [Lepeophtheirus salmonis]CAF2885185.1 unnamed protein product [Lepeophtheirus salmonis]